MRAYEATDASCQCHVKQRAKEVKLYTEDRAKGGVCMHGPDEKMGDLGKRFFAKI